MNNFKHTFVWQRILICLEYFQLSYHTFNKQVSEVSKKSSIYKFLSHFRMRFSKIPRFDRKPLLWVLWITNHSLLNLSQKWRWTPCTSFMLRKRKFLIRNKWFFRYYFHGFICFSSLWWNTPYIFSSWWWSTLYFHDLNSWNWNIMLIVSNLTNTTKVIIE